jgi:hypothetical protein
VWRTTWPAPPVLVVPAIIGRGKAAASWDHCPRGRSFAAFVISRVVGRERISSSAQLLIGVDANQDPARAKENRQRSAVIAKSSGQIVGRRCRQDYLFQVFEKLGEHKALQFGRDGFLVTVDAADVVEVQYRCPQCGEEAGDGIYGRRRARWLPRR